MVDGGQVGRVGQVGQVGRVGNLTDPTHPTQHIDETHPSYQTGQSREFAVVLLAAAALTVLLTYPLAVKLGTAGRIDNGDGQFSIWNVAWVARALVVDPLHVFDANIFYSHKGTLAYSESNIGAGALAVPAYWATRNPYFAHNVVVLLAFMLATTGTYYLVRYLTRDRRAAAVSAVCFAFCPYVFARTAHIQLLMTAGLPFGMLAFHRVADRPTVKRGAVLGATMAAQAICCGYYGVFLLLMVGFASLVTATTRRLWTNGAYWGSLATGAVTALVLVAPFFAPYVALQRVSGFNRPISEAGRYSANWSAYFASSAYAHRWMLRMLPPWNEVVFPGFVALGFGVAGLWIARRRLELTLIYGGLAVLACWASFGPDAGLYTLLYDLVPLFAWLRAPGRFGLVVVFGLSVLAGIAVSTVLQRPGRFILAAPVVAVLAAAELVTPFRLTDIPPIAPAYRTLATLPRGPLIEMPFFYQRMDYHRHTLYMLHSTTHWNPLVNGYSDYFPEDFDKNVMTLAPFPSRDAFKLLEPHRVRYAIFHMRSYNSANRHDVLTRLGEFSQFLRPLYVDDEMRLYEIIGFPP